ncbi:MAG: acyl-CoA thioesterase [Thermoplasmata archaeon]|nr:acyl-CoA thioesterase [Thermoplasmata archaeon]
MTPEGTTPHEARSAVLHHRVAFGETDAGGLVFYPNYLRWFDQATHELFRALGLPLKELQARWSVVLPVVSVQANFRTALHYDDEMEIHSQIAELSERSLKVTHSVRCGGTEVSSGWEIRAWIGVDGGTFQAQPIPLEMRQRLT